MSVVPKHRPPYPPELREQLVAKVTQAELDIVATKLNTRPRKALGYQTPATVFDQVLH